MEYRKKLYDAVDKFFMEIVIPYGRTNSEASKQVKKFSPFTKKSYSVFINNFISYGEQTEAISAEKSEIPPDDRLALDTAEALEACRISFPRLCRRNADFYEFQERKAKGGSVSMEELKDLTLKVQLAMNSAARDMDILENAYKEMKADDEPEYAEVFRKEKEARAKAECEAEMKARSRALDEAKKKEKKKI